MTAGLWLTAWSLLVGDLVEARHPLIGPLVFLTTLGCLMAALSDSFATLIGATVLLFIFWLPHMVTESIWQAVRVRAFLAAADRLSPLAQVALAAADVAAFVGTALLVAASYGDAPDGRRLAAVLVLVTLGVLVRAIRRARYRPVPDRTTAREGSARRVFVCPNATLTGRRRLPGR